MSIGERLRQARKAAHLTQEQLAQKCGIATITVRQYESNKRTPSFEQLEKMGDILQVNWLFLIGNGDAIGIDSVEEAKKVYAEYQVHSKIRDFIDTLLADMYGEVEHIRRDRISTENDVYVYGVGERKRYLDSASHDAILESGAAALTASIEMLVENLSYISMPEKT